MPELNILDINTPKQLGTRGRDRPIAKKAYLVNIDKEVITSPPGSDFICSEGIGDRKTQEDVFNIIRDINFDSLDSKAAAQGLTSVLGKLDEGIKNARLSSGATFTGSLQVRNPNGSVSVITMSVGDSKTVVFRKEKDAQGRFTPTALSCEHEFTSAESLRILNDGGELSIRAENPNVLVNIKKIKDTEKYFLKETSIDPKTNKPIVTSKEVTANEVLDRIAVIDKEHILRQEVVAQDGSGGLNMPRALGDLKFPGVISQPDYTIISIPEEEKDNSLIIHGCDGLWDILSPLDVAELISFFYNKDVLKNSEYKSEFLTDITKNREITERKKESSGNLAEFLRRVAYSYSDRNSDNITCVITNITENRFTYIADGHGGTTVVNYIKAKIKALIQKFVAEASVTPQALVKKNVLKDLDELENLIGQNAGRVTIIQNQIAKLEKLYPNEKERSIETTFLKGELKFFLNRKELLEKKKREIRKQFDENKDPYQPLKLNEYKFSPVIESLVNIKNASASSAHKKMRKLLEETYAALTDLIKRHEEKLKKLNEEKREIQKRGSDTTFITQEIELAQHKREHVINAQSNINNCVQMYETERMSTPSDNTQVLNKLAVRVNQTIHIYFVDPTTAGPVHEAYSCDKLTKIATKIKNFIATLINATPTKSTHSEQVGYALAAKSKGLFAQTKSSQLQRKEEALPPADLPFMPSSLLPT